MEKSDSTFALNDFELSIVTFVACIRRMSTKTTQSAYLMEDGTASVDVRQFHAQKVDGQDNSMDEAVDSNGENGLRCVFHMVLFVYILARVNMSEFMGNCAHLPTRFT